MNNAVKTVTPKELSQALGVTTACLRKWDNEGKIRSIVTEGGHRRYIQEELATTQGKSIIYCRVSSAKQKNDLQRQIDYLKAMFPNHDVIKDIGSGLNFKRKGLLNLLELVFSRQVTEVVVAHKDRLCRFGFELFEFIFQKHGAVLKVLEDQGIKEPIQEFAEDVLSIVTVFTARYYGSRKYQILSKNKDISNQRTETVVQSMHRSKPILLQQGKRFCKIRVRKSKNKGSPRKTRED